MFILTNKLVYRKGVDHLCQFYGSDKGYKLSTYKYGVSDKHLQGHFLDIPSILLQVGKCFISWEDLVVRDEQA